MIDAAQTANADDLADLVDCVSGAERLLARAVLLAGRVAGSGACEAVEGLPLEHYLGLACRLTGADRRTLVAAGETLADLPCVATLFSSGGLSWGPGEGDRAGGPPAPDGGPCGAGRQGGRDGPA